MNSQTSNNKPTRNESRVGAVEPIITPSNNELDKILKYVGDWEDYEKTKQQLSNLIKEARIDAIKSYKKVNKMLEKEIRIDELNKIDEHYWLDDDTDVYIDMIIKPYIESRLLELESVKGFNIGKDK